MNKKEKCIVISLVILTIATYIRLLFVGVEPDEQYALTLAYKLLDGQAMFKDCFEIHQTSAILIKLLLQLKYIILPSTNYDMLYLRFAGAIIQMCVSYYVFYTCKNKDKSTYESTMISLLSATFLTKFSLVPDYGNQQMWLITIIVCGILNNMSNKKLNILTYVAMGLLVLAYPPFIIIYVLLIVVVIDNKKLKVNAILISTLTVVIMLATTGFNMDILSISNIFGNNLHSGIFIDRLKYELTHNFNQHIITLLTLVSIIVLKSGFVKRVYDKYKYNLYNTVMLGITLYSLYDMVANKLKCNFQCIYLVAIVILVNNYIDTHDSNKYLKLLVVTYFIHMIQFIVNNQVNLIMCRYLIITILVLLICSKTKLLGFFLYLLCIFNIMQLSLPTSDFYNYSDKLSYINVDGSLNGIWVDTKLYEKIHFVKGANLKGKSVLVIDSNSCLYDCSGLSIYCPDTVDTPYLNDKFINYYESTESKPDYIIISRNLQYVQTDDKFDKFVTDNYIVYTNNDIISILRSNN